MLRELLANRRRSANIGLYVLGSYLFLQTDQEKRLAEEFTGALVPAHHITQLTFTNNGKTVMVANFSTAVSKNPYFGFKFRGAKAGDTLNVAWVDNLGETDEIETVLE